MLALAVVAAATLLVLLSQPDRSLSTVFPGPAGIEDPSRFTVTEVRRDEVSGVAKLTVTARDGPVTLQVHRLTGVSPELARGYIRDVRTRIESLFADAGEPYVGVDPGSFNCSDRFMPSVTNVTRDGITYTHISLYADDEMRFGRRNRFAACNEETAVYNASVVLAYCPGQRTVYHLEQFVPRSGDQAADVTAGFSCSEGEGAGSSLPR